MKGLIKVKKKKGNDELVVGICLGFGVCNFLAFFFVVVVAVVMMLIDVVYIYLISCRSNHKFEL